MEHTQQQSKDNLWYSQVVALYVEVGGSKVDQEDAEEKGRESLSVALPTPPAAVEKVIAFTNPAEILLSVVEEAIDVLRPVIQVAVAETCGLVALSH